MADRTEIRQRWGTEYSAPGRESTYAWWGDREVAEREIATQGERGVSVRLVFRYVITTPPEPVQEVDGG